MARRCPNCGVDVVDGAAQCPICGQVGAGSEGPLTILDRIVASCSYVIFLPAVVFLLVNPFRRNRFIRFHCFQSIFLVVAAVLVAVLARLVFVVLTFIPVLIAFLIAGVFCLAGFVLWVLLMVKALQGQSFKLPWIGQLSENYARRIA
jgi:uncharacterized membrane protein